MHFWFVYIKTYTVPTYRKPVYTERNYNNGSNNIYNDKQIQLYYTDILVICLGPLLVKYKLIIIHLDPSTSKNSVSCCCWICYCSRRCTSPILLKVQNYMRRKKLTQWSVLIVVYL